MTALPRLLSLSNIQSPGSWHRLRIVVLVVSLALLLLIWGLVLLGLQRERQLAIQSAGTAQDNLSVVVAENLRQLLQRGQSFAEAAFLWEQRGVANTGARLADLRTGDPAYNRLALFSLKGAALYESSPADMSGIPGFIKSQAAAFAKGDAPALMIVPRMGTGSQSWQIPLLFPVRSPDGGIGAILEADMDLGYLLRLYQQLDMGKSGEILFVTDDGQELARINAGGLEIQGDARNTRVPPTAQRLAYTHGMAAYPVQVTISQSVDDILARLAVRDNRLVYGLLLLSAMLVCLSFWINSLLRQHQIYFENLVESESEKQQLIGRLENERQYAYELAAQDHLTGVFNRRRFTDLASNHLASARRNRHISAIMFIDLDRFKSINDTLGHNVGDLLLKVVARRLRETLRESDIIARFGGDEFVIMTTSLSDEAQIEALAARVSTVLSLPCPDLDGHTVQTTPSIGIAVYPRDGEDVDTLLLHADTAMYRAKTGGRGIYVFFDPSIKNNSTLEFELEQRLPSAIGNKEFELHFQPKVDIHDFSFTGFEALIRWRHPQHGLIFPNDFIPLAEKSGHIGALGSWVIEAACQQLAAWRDEGSNVLPIAINLSARQLHDPRLASKIVDTLVKYRLDTALLQVEITENSLIENVELAGQIMRTLDDAGIQISLDDFGTGFSSLGYIKALPIDTIKIDRAFIRDLNNSQDDAVIVTSIIALAHNLGMKVVAEGVETRDQLIYLKTAGCDQAQGYLFSRPVSADQVRALLQQPSIALV